MGIIVGIDASRNRSGGARAHIIGILSALNGKSPDNVDEVHVWSYDSLLNQLPKYSWLIKHRHEDLEKGLISQVYWQRVKLPKEAKISKIDIMLNTDAGTVCRFFPSITMSRDMLSYEPGEMKRFGWSAQRLRLLALKLMQNTSLKKSTAAIFLTKYAADAIQKSSGRIKNYTVIPHGVSDNFRLGKSAWSNSEKDIEPINLIYVSNVAPYKHQIHVAKAIHYLKEKGYNLVLTLVGGGEGKSQQDLENYMNKHDSNHKFLIQKEFVKHSDLSSLIEKSDLFVFASSCENMPNTLIEGMCSGLPIACSNRGPMPEVLENGGVYFDPENYLSIAEAVETIINDENLRLEKAKISQNLSHKYSWERCAYETFDFLNKTYKTYNG